MSSHSERDCKRERERERGSATQATDLLRWRYADLDVATGALLSAARHLDTLHLHCYLRYIFPAALRCGIDCKRFAISITTDATWRRRRRRRRRLLFAFGLAAIDLNTEVDLCNRYKGICRSAIFDPRSLSILQLNRDQDRDLWRLCALWSSCQRRVASALQICHWSTSTLLTTWAFCMTANRPWADLQRQLRGLAAVRRTYLTCHSQLQRTN